MQASAPKRSLKIALMFAALSLGTFSVSLSAEIELLNGIKVEGTVLSKDTTSLKVLTEAGGKKVTLTYQLKSVHSVTINGKRHVINEKVNSPNGTNGLTSGNAKSTLASRGSSVSRTPEEIQSLITDAGRKQPEWFATTPLNYPKTLDLSWPDSAPGSWNNQKNVGQWVWDIVNPNPSRWRDGVRLMHHLLIVHKDNVDNRNRIMAELGRMYFELLEDYPRAAFWYQQSGIGKGGEAERSKNGAHLAECYWRLGSKPMAVGLLKRLPVTYESIKLWGDLGETKKSVELATKAIPTARWPSSCYLLIGDAYRVVGEYDQAIMAYQKAVAEAEKPDHAKEEKLKARALANLQALKAAEALDLTKIGDGTYNASSLGYEGQVEVEVRVAAGRIEAVRVTGHKEKQFYSSLEDTPRKIIARQGIQGVDGTSGATITSEAIINATAKALGGQK
jgi:uncharacterized protein with FMN-binding domain